MQATHANTVTESFMYHLLGLVNPKSVISRYDTRIAKEVLSPLRVAEYNHVGADPHYCSLTSNLQVTPTPQRRTYSNAWHSLQSSTTFAPVSLSMMRFM